jgi:hypothetical protein
MTALLFIIFITGLSVFISYTLSADATWFDFYRGGILGFFLSGVVLYLVNKSKRAKEMRKDARK